MTRKSSSFFKFGRLKFPIQQASSDSFRENFPSQVIFDPHLVMLRAECDSVILDAGLSDGPKNRYRLLPGDQIACIITSPPPLFDLEIIHLELPVFSSWRTVHSASSEALTRWFRYNLPPCTRRRKSDFVEWERHEIPVEGAWLEVDQLLLVETSRLLLLHPPWMTMNLVIERKSNYFLAIINSQERRRRILGFLQQRLSTP